MKSPCDLSNWNQFNILECMLIIVLILTESIQNQSDKICEQKELSNVPVRR